jgi:hypothetical protein
MESHRDVWFAALSKLATSSATLGFCRLVGVGPAVQ